MSKKLLFYRWRLIAAAIIVIAGGLGSWLFIQSNQRLATTQAATTRNALQWPFASNSIWNMPIGSNAKYVPANLTKANALTSDPNYLITTTNADPLHSFYAPGSFGPGRCTGTQMLGSDQYHVPDNLVVGDAIRNATQYSTPNAAAAIVQPDGRSMVQVEPLARCTAGGNVYGWIACGWGHVEDIQGQGLCGGHFGSGLSSIGGMLNKGDLTSADPIHHALQLEIWMEMYAYYSKDLPGYRWPASTADNGADHNYCTMDPCKSHPNPALAEGSLLAIPSSVTPESLGISTNAGKKMFHALQDYGGYLVDDTGWNVFQVGIASDAQDEFNALSSNLSGDALKMYEALQVVDNNGPNNIGGGGTLRAPQAPPFADGTGGVNATPTPISTPAPTATPTMAPTSTATATPVAVTPTPVAHPTKQPIIVSTSPPQNNVGTSNDKQPSGANYDGGGFSYSAQALQKAGITPGQSLNLNGVTFSWPNSIAGTEDNYQGEQTLPVTATNAATTLAFLGSSTNGPSRGTAIITYTDGSQQRFNLGMSDWTLNAGKTKPTYGNSAVITMPYRNSLNCCNGRQVVKTYVFYAEVALQAGKTIQSVTLPHAVNRGKLHIFAL